MGDRIQILIAEDETNLRRVLRAQLVRDGYDVHDVGEEPDWSTAISTGCGLPVWVNHVAFHADAEKQEEVRARMEAEGIELHMECDHGIFYSLYWVDPNGIMVELSRDTRGITADPERARSLLHATTPTDESTIVKG